MHETIYIVNLMRYIKIIVLIFVAYFPLFSAQALTGLEAYRLAINQVHEELADNGNGCVRGIYSVNEGKSVSPDHWNVVFFDPAFENNYYVVQVRNGKASEPQGAAQEMNRALEANAFNPKYIKIDSDQALQIVQKLPELSKINMSGYELSLTRIKKYRFAWTFTLYGVHQKTGKPTPFGIVKVSALTGEVFFKELSPVRLN